MNPHVAEARSHGNRLVRNDPNLVGKAVHLHRETHRRAADLDQAGVIGPAVEAQLTQPCRIEFVRGGSGGWLLVETLNGGVIGQFHDALFYLYMQLYPEKNTAASALGPQSGQLLGD